MLRTLLAMLCSFFGQTTEEVPLDPFIAKLKFPAKLPASYTHDERCTAVANLLRNKCPDKVSLRIVDRVSGYYGVNLSGKGIFTRDPHNRKMLVFN